jgi:hypothetical protein
MKKETLNTILNASGLAVSIMGLLVTVMGILAAVVAAAFVGGLLVGAFITWLAGASGRRERR